MNPPDKAPGVTLPKLEWFALADSRRARLLEAGFTRPGRPRLLDRGELIEQWDEALHEHHRPSMLSAGGRTHASFKHEDEERIHRFARELAVWLRARLVEHRIKGLTVFCSLPLLGPLRAVCARESLAGLDLRRGDLVHLTLPQLLAHPVIAENFRP